MIRVALVVPYFAIATGAILGPMSNATKKKSVLYLSAPGLALFSLYCSWVVWLHSYAGNVRWSALLRPGILWTTMNEVAAQGAWGIRKWRPDSDALGFFWLLEAVCVSVVSLFMAQEGIVDAAGDDEGAAGKGPKAARTKNEAAVPDDDIVGGKDGGLRG
jgi:hypothetical protein